MRPNQVLPLKVRVDLKVMTMKGYFSFTESLELEPHHKII